MKRTTQAAVLTSVLGLAMACSEAPAEAQAQQAESVPPSQAKPMMNQTAQTERTAQANDEATEFPAPGAGSDATARFMGSQGDEIGTVEATDGPNGVLMRVSLSGLSEGYHAIHLHQVGDCSDYDAGFKASGSHVNPGGNEHGLLNEAGYEAADLPNLYVHADGTGRGEFFTDKATLTELNDQDGFAVLVHENEDDHMTQPIGGAGGRVACAAVGATGGGM
ncbi:superoxide dismutase family protein [Parvularcula dongshanensis]|uniref:Superoxide dismutase [Cu-Zn] n=1 Tax=Parvularcula dongshanensis TaxID=1173995 RepID=A0A840I2E8_9PROT|nr:superoxide dismutase family protein [Parvularcula dongshanensis]MBB4658472.1 Cu-Zn family superoxide dismutase [Parvularcula dongshanensis]